MTRLPDGAATGDVLQLVKWSTRTRDDGKRGMMLTKGPRRDWSRTACTQAQRKIGTSALSLFHDLPHGGGSERKGREEGSASYIVAEARSEKISLGRFTSRNSGGGGYGVLSPHSTL